MDILTLDWETYYAQDYSLLSSTTEAYIHDPRFEEILLGVKDGDAPAYWLLPDRAAAFLAEEVDWADTALITHHAHFDGAILAWKHGIKPALHIDTLSMARILDGPKVGHRLEDIALRHGVGQKGDYVTYAKGKRLNDFTNAELWQYGAYCVKDCELTYSLARIFLEQMPAEELQIIDRVIRCFTEPVFIGDVARLRGAVASEKQRKQDVLRRIGMLCLTCGGDGVDRQFPLIPTPAGGAMEGRACPKCDGTGVDKKTIGSNEKLAALFRACGIEPKTKTSPSTGEQIYAFAKTDSAMQEMLEDEYEDVRFLAEARIAIKSNIIETRAAKFADMAERGPMPVYISYGAAHTFRMGGGDSLNWLNISSKHNANRPELSVIAASIMAPPGHKIVTADSGQGEARITAWLAGQHDLVEAFARGRDVYSEHASTIYGRPVDGKNNLADRIPRQLGKASVLGMGFGMGWYKASMELLKGMLGNDPIQFTADDMAMLRVNPSRFLNNPARVMQVSTMPSRLELNDRLIHCAVTNALIERYRAKMSRITGVGLPPGEIGYWQLMDQVIDSMIWGREMVFGAHGVMRTAKDKIWMPNGLAMRFDGLERGNDGRASYYNGRERVELFGAKLVENTVQSLHYIIVSRQLLDIAKVLKVALTTYDDVVTVVREDIAADALAFMIDEMSKTPAWATGLPLVGEGKIGSTLKEAS